MNITDIESRMRSFERQTATTGKKLWHKLTQRSHGRAFESHDGPSSVVGLEEIAELELLSESLVIDKEKIADGELSIRKEVITELQTIQVPVTREELVIERRSADGRCTSEVLSGQRQLRIPISKERVVVRKEPVVSEIANITRRKVVATKYISSPVRHEELRVDHRGEAQISSEDSKAA